MIYGRLVSLYVSREQSYKLRGSSSNTSSLSSLSGAAPEVSKCVFSFIGEFWFLCFAFLNCLYSEMIVVEPSIPTMKSKLQDIVNKTLDEMISILTSQMSSRYQSFSLFLNSQPILSSSSPLIRETTHLILTSLSFIVSSYISQVTTQYMVGLLGVFSGSFEILKNLVFFILIIEKFSTKVLQVAVQCEELPSHHASLHNKKFTTSQ